MGREVRIRMVSKVSPSFYNTVDLSERSLQPIRTAAGTNIITADQTMRRTHLYHSTCKALSPPEGVVDLP